MTNIYLIRHSIPFKEHMGAKLVNDDLLSWNMKMPLSVKGEELARNYFDKDEFRKIDVIFSSSYVRAMSTAKYLAYQNNLLVNVNSCFDERIHGINDWSELPKNFEIMQFMDSEYKMGNGESKKEVTERVLNGINKILEEYKGKEIAIIGHATAFAFLLNNWCLIDSEKYCYYYKDKIVFDGIWNYLETFKLTFDEDNKLINIFNLYHKV